MALLKIVLGVFMVGVVGVASFLWGMPGFVGTALLAVIISWSISKREKEELEQKRHQEMLDAIAANKGEESK